MYNKPFKHAKDINCPYCKNRWPEQLTIDMSTNAPEEYK